MNITEEDLKKAATEYTQTLEQAKQNRDEIIRQAHAEGWKQADIVRSTGLTRETIRRIIRPEIGEAVLKAAVQRRAEKRQAE